MAQKRPCSYQEERVAKLRENTVLVLSCLYLDSVCPEPVLANRSFLVLKWLHKRRLHTLKFGSESGTWRTIEVSPVLDRCQQVGPSSGRIVLQLSTVRWMFRSCTSKGNDRRLYVSPAEHTSLLQISLHFSYACPEPVLAN